jgi:hypothetical protein
MPSRARSPAGYVAAVRCALRNLPHFFSRLAAHWTPGAGPYRRCQARSANDDFGDCTHFLCRPRHLGDGMEGGGDGS